MPITFYPSQVGGPTGKIPIAYTGNPFLLCWSDIKLIWRQKGRVGNICRPLRLIPWELDEWDELYPSPKNLVAMVTHFILLILQTIFIISIPACVFNPVVPLWAFIAWVSIFLSFNYAVCRVLLNGGTNKLESKVGVQGAEKFQQEYWIYLNGVSVGRDWLQSNIDRLSYTFGRKVVGILNPTDGIIFDLFQCMVQRNLSYSTQDVRGAYALIKEALLNEEYQKVVFVLHSQGGIEGGLVIDWLLDEMPQDRMQRLEVYTFGNAANHFNNPHRSLAGANLAQSAGTKLDVNTSKQSKAIRYVEHYANEGDFVAQFGVLNFTQVSNRFMGRIFKSQKSGHLLNMHYLHEMFPLETIPPISPEGTPTFRAKDHSEFMETEVKNDPTSPAGGREDLRSSIFGSGTQNELDQAWVGDINTPISPLVLNSARPVDSPREIDHMIDVTTTHQREPIKWKVKHFSRLWMYRNGGSPPQDMDLIPKKATF